MNTAQLCCRRRENASSDEAWTAGNPLHQKGRGASSFLNPGPSVGSIYFRALSILYSKELLKTQLSLRHSEEHDICNNSCQSRALCSYLYFEEFQIKEYKKPLYYLPSSSSYNQYCTCETGTELWLTNGSLNRTDLICKTEYV